MISRKRRLDRKWNSKRFASDPERRYLQTQHFQIGQTLWRTDWNREDWNSHGAILHRGIDRRTPCRPISIGSQHHSLRSIRSVNGPIKCCMQVCARNRFTIGRKLSNIYLESLRDGFPCVCQQQRLRRFRSRYYAVAIFALCSHRTSNILRFHASRSIDEDH